MPKKLPSFNSLVLKAAFLFVFLQGAPLEEPLWAPHDMQVDDLLTIIKVRRSVINFGGVLFVFSLKSNGGAAHGQGSNLCQSVLLNTGGRETLFKNYLGT